MLGLYNVMSGGAFAEATVFALGVQPYINSSIIIQLLTIAIPALERLARDGGEAGKKKKMCIRDRMKASEVRAMSVAELNTKLDALKKDLFMLRMQHATNQLDNPQKLVQTKRDIARVKTMIREKEEK